MKNIKPTQEKQEYINSPFGNPEEKIMVPVGAKEECPCSCHKSAKDPQEGCKHCTHSPLDNSLKDMDTKDTDWEKEFETKFALKLFDANGIYHGREIKSWIKQTISTEVQKERARIRKEAGKLAWIATDGVTPSLIIKLSDLDNISNEVSKGDKPVDLYPEDTEGRI